MPDCCSACRKARPVRFYGPDEDLPDSAKPYYPFEVIPVSETWVRSVYVCDYGHAWTCGWARHLAPFE